MKKEKLTDVEKLHGCCVVIKTVIDNSVTDKEFRELIKKNLGNGWSYTAIVQYLKNKKALDTATSLAWDYNVDGISKRIILEIIAGSHLLEIND